MKKLVDAGIFKSVCHVTVRDRSGLQYKVLAIDNVDGVDHVEVRELFSHDFLVLPVDEFLGFFSVN